MNQIQTHKDLMPMLSQLRDNAINEAKFKVAICNDGSIVTSFVPYNRHKMVSCCCNQETFMLNGRVRCGYCGLVTEAV